MYKVWHVHANLELNTFLLLLHMPSAICDIYVWPFVHGQPKAKVSKDFGSCDDPPFEVSPPVLHLPVSQMQFSLSWSILLLRCFSTMQADSLCHFNEWAMPEEPILWNQLCSTVASLCPPDGAQYLSHPWCRIQHDVFLWISLLGRKFNATHFSDLGQLPSGSDCKEVYEM